MSDHPTEHKNTTEDEDPVIYEIPSDRFRDPIEYKRKHIPYLTMLELAREFFEIETAGSVIMKENHLVITRIFAMRSSVIFKCGEWVDRFVIHQDPLLSRFVVNAMDYYEKKLVLFEVDNSHLRPGLTIFHENSFSGDPLQNIIDKVNFEKAMEEYASQKKDKGKKKGNGKHKKHVCGTRNPKRQMKKV